MPNLLAYLMLILWSPIVLIMFRRLSIERALIWSILGGYLILPPVAVFNLPLLPGLDKVTIPNIAAFVSAMIVTQGRIPVLPQSLLGRIGVLLFLLSPIGTVLTNLNPVIFRVGGLSAMQLPEVVTGSIAQFFILMPFLLGRHILAKPQAMRELILALVVGGLFYSIPMLIEVRLSPQINVWVYGFFQHSFDQMMRYGGFRPIVFLPHGLWVAFFTFMMVIATLALVRYEPPENRLRYLIIAGYLAVVLLLCKSVGALFFAVVVGPLALFAGRRTQIRVASAFAIVVMLYPMLRGAGLIPVDAILSTAVSFDAERGQSLGFRLMNEDLLLAHASTKPFFGWGGWDRNLVHDPTTGLPISVTDGAWIITIGMNGWFGYLGQFGLLTLPLISLARLAGSVPMARLSPYIAPLALILATNMVDLVPNATLIPFTWLMAGAILGYVEQERRQSTLASPPAAAAVATKARPPAPWAKVREKT